MADAPGTRFGHYRIIAPIGTGGFATVYRAVDERLDAEVALKVLAENHALDPDIRERFITEAQLLRRVAGDAVVEIHDLGETDRGQPFLVLSHADRGDLRARVDGLRAEGPPLTEPDVDVIIDILGRSLAAVHQAGLVHRDVKPENLLISSQGGPAHGSRVLRDGERLQLGDLGYAKDLIASSGLTVGGGTVGFNAPEQRKGMAVVDRRADVYGASAVVYWALSGSTPPMDPEQRQQSLEASRLSPAMVEVLGRGLAEEPENRFPSIEAWLEALGRVHPGTVTPPTRAESRAAPEPAPPAPSAGNGRRRGLMLAAAGLVIGLGVGALGISVLGTDDDGPTTSVTDDGRTRVSESDGSLQLAIFGQPTLAVGDTVEFEAAVNGASSFHWLTPDGQVVPGRPTVTFVAETAGQGQMTLVGRNAAGAVVTVTFPFTVEENS